jgi:hypothetical protein
VKLVFACAYERTSIPISQYFEHKPQEMHMFSLTVTRKRPNFCVKSEHRGHRAEVPAPHTRSTNRVCANADSRRTTWRPP